MKEKCDFPAFTGHRLDDEILHIEFKKVKKLTGEDIKQIFECQEKVRGEGGVYVMVTFAGFIPMNDEAMSEAKKLGAKQASSATAYVVSNVALRLGINFFMNFYRPKQPMHISKTKPEALVWLNKQKDKNRR